MIFVECKPDKVLVRILGIPTHEIIHAGNKSSVCKKLERSNGSKGLVDEDPDSGQPTYIRRLEIIDMRSDFKILYDPRRDNYLIILCPRLEEWILKAAREAKVEVKKYNLPNNGDYLHRIINLKIDKFERLVLDLRSKSRMLKDLESILKQ